MDLDFAKLDGLIPAIVQDARTGEVLMLGFMNEQAYAETRSSGAVTFFSRTRGQALAQGRTERPHAARARSARGLRRGHDPGARRSGRARASATKATEAAFSGAWTTMARNRRRGTHF